MKSLSTNHAKNPNNFSKNHLLNTIIIENNCDSPSMKLANESVKGPNQLMLTANEPRTKFFISANKIQLQKNCILSHPSISQTTDITIENLDRNNTGQPNNLVKGIEINKHSPSKNKPNETITVDETDKEKFLKDVSLATNPTNMQNFQIAQSHAINQKNPASASKSSNGSMANNTREISELNGHLKNFEGFVDEIKNFQQCVVDKNNSISGRLKHLFYLKFLHMMIHRNFKRIPSGSIPVEIFIINEYIENELKNEKSSKKIKINNNDNLIPRSLLFIFESLHSSTSYSNMLIKSEISFLFGQFRFAPSRHFLSPVIASLKEYRVLKYESALAISILEMISLSSSTQNISTREVRSLEVKDKVQTRANSLNNAPRKISESGLEMHVNNQFKTKMSVMNNQTKITVDHLRNNKSSGMNSMNYHAKDEKIIRDENILEDEDNGKKKNTVKIIENRTGMANFHSLRVNDFSAQVKEPKINTRNIIKERYAFYSNGLYKDNKIEKNRGIVNDDSDYSKSFILDESTIRNFQVKETPIKGGLQHYVNTYKNS